MTFLDMAKQERNILNEEHLIQDTCPSDFGYEPKEKCKAIIGLEEKDKDYICRRCWEREMPNTNQKEDGIPVIPQSEVDAYNKGHADGVAQGLNDAWELANKIHCEILCGELDKIFGYSDTACILEAFTPQEALAKLKAYEDSKIEVGDVVRFKETHNIYVIVTHTFTHNFDAVDEKGSVYSEMEFKDWEKTGKHIDIKSILEQIGE